MFFNKYSHVIISCKGPIGSFNDETMGKITSKLLRYILRSQRMLSFIITCKFWLIIRQPFFLRKSIKVWKYTIAPQRPCFVFRMRIMISWKKIFLINSVIITLRFLQNWSAQSVYRLLRDFKVNTVISHIKCIPKLHVQSHSMICRKKTWTQKQEKNNNERMNPGSFCAHEENQHESNYNSTEWALGQQVR